MPGTRLIYDINAPFITRASMVFRGRQYQAGETFDVKALGLSERRIMALCAARRIKNPAAAKVSGLGGLIALAALGACASRAVRGTPDQPAPVELGGDGELPVESPTDATGKVDDVESAPTGAIEGLEPVEIEPEAEAEAPEPEAIAPGDDPPTDDPPRRRRRRAGS